MGSQCVSKQPKILHVKRRDFLQLNWLGCEQCISWSCCDGDFNSAWAGLPCCFSKGSLQKDFLEIYMTTVSESVISKIENLWGSSFAYKYSKFNLDFVNAAENWQKKNFFHVDNCIWIGIVNLCLLRTP